MPWPITAGAVTLQPSTNTNTNPHHHALRFGILQQGTQIQTSRTYDYIFMLTDPVLWKFQSLKQLKFSTAQAQGTRPTNVPHHLGLTITHLLTQFTRTKFWISPLLNAEPTHQ
jgi:hypothetical protein